MLINQSFVSKSAIQSWRPRLFLSVNMWALLAFRNAFLHWVSRPRPEYWRGENRSTNSQARFLLPWPIYADKISDKGLPYMTSARFSDILTPSPPCYCHKSAGFVPFICFLGSPSPIHSGRHIWKAPNANGLGLTLRGKRGERSQIMHLDQLFMEPQESTFPCFVCNLCGMTDKNNTIKQKVIALNWIREYFFLL